MMRVRVSKEVKKEARKVARSLGVSLPLVVEHVFRRFAAERRLVVEESGARGYVGRPSQY